MVRVTGENGERAIPFAEFHRLPGDTPHVDTHPRTDEIITSVDLPARGFADHHAYLKVRDRKSYAFALVSVAAVLEMSGDTITEARVALGGVAHKPWRNKEAEAMLNGNAAKLTDLYRWMGYSFIPRGILSKSDTRVHGSTRELAGLHQRVYRNVIPMRSRGISSS